MSMLGTVPVFPGWGSAESLDLKFSNNVYFSGDTGIEDCEALSSTLGTEQFIEDTNLGDSFVYDSQLQAHFRPLGTTASSSIGASLANQCHHSAHSVPYQAHRLAQRPCHQLQVVLPLQARRRLAHLLRRRLAHLLFQPWG